MFDPGSQVSGTITYKGQTFEFSARVAWAKQGDVRLGIRGRMGVQITGIAPGYYVLLEADTKA